MPSPPNLTIRRAHESDLRRLMNLTAAGITLGGVILLAIIAFAAWTANKSATERERSLLQNALNMGIARTLNEQKSVAWWDDSVLKITREEIDLEFVDSNVGYFLTETYGHDQVFILDADDRPLYAFMGGSRRDPTSYERYRAPLADLLAEVRTSRPPVLRQRPDVFGAEQGDYRTLSGARDVARWSGHILSIDGQLSIVAAITIAPNVDMDLVQAQPNVLISIVAIDDQYVARLGRSLVLPDLTLASTLPEQSGKAAEPISGDDGTDGGYLVWTTERPGKTLLTVILPLVALGVIGVAIQAHVMFSRLRQTSEILAERERQSRHAARHDGLSGLPNRSHFDQNLRREIENISRDIYGRRAIVAYIDVDRFKDVNDTLGHPAGDALIVQVAQRLASHVRQGDFLARYGGDEFAILWITNDRRAASFLAERIAKAFLQPFDLAGQSLIVTASIGIAMAPEDGMSAEEIMRCADIALYEAKSAGRNRTVIFSENMAEQVKERRAIELDLPAAITGNQLALAYQPIISCRTGAITGIEALLRWQHPERGTIPPGVFIPIAEQAGLMPLVGEWVLNRAMEDWHRWPHLDVSINLSPLQFRQPGFLDRLSSICETHAVDPRHIVLEITEGVLMDAGDNTRAMLDMLRARGFRLALDDFGTGYSSLAYLCNFRFDKIKIDRSFVSGLSQSERYHTIVRTVITLGQGLGMEIVAEGVETEREALTMTQLGSSEMQGYYFSRPVSADRLSELLIEHTPQTLAARPIEAQRDAAE